MKRTKPSDDPPRNVRQKNAENKSWFDDLEPEALGNIFRHHADFPRVADWTAAENRSVLIDVSHPEYPLRAAAQDIVKELSVGRCSAHAQKTLSDAFASRCSSLSLKTRPMETWLACRNLKKLKLEYKAANHPAAFRSLLAAQTELEELDVFFHQSSPLISVDIMDAIAEHGAGLKKLVLSVIDARHKESLSRVLEVTGRALQTLRIGGVKGMDAAPVDHALFDITSIYILCPHITDLTVGTVDVTEENGLLVDDHLNLFCAYGAQLRKIGGLPTDPPIEDFLGEIATCCPNAGVDADLSYTFFLDTVGILGPQIESLSMSESEYAPAVDMRACLSTKCSNVKVLSIGLANASAFFGAPKPNLGRLLLIDHRDRHEYEDIARIAANSGGLREIALDGSLLGRKALKQLACANECLERVTVYPRFSDAARTEEDCSAYMVNLIECFLDCKFLK